MNPKIHTVKWIKYEFTAIGSSCLNKSTTQNSSTQKVSHDYNTERYNQNKSMAGESHFITFNT